MKERAAFVEDILTDGRYFFRRLARTMKKQLIKNGKNKRQSLKD